MGQTTCADEAGGICHALNRGNARAMIFGKPEDDDAFDAKGAVERNGTQRRESRRVAEKNRKLVHERDFRATSSHCHSSPATQRLLRVFVNFLFSVQNEGMPSLAVLT
jgi:hypothetical protein